ncbi:MAG: hypothetical protein H0X29_01155 [Parachlamydiaceae bacterium]|nr:hypothetical protein [Parachlamydiaceae bacterium]
MTIKKTHAATKASLSTQSTPHPNCDKIKVIACCEFYAFFEMHNCRIQNLLFKFIKNFYSPFYRHFVYLLRQIAVSENSLNTSEVSKMALSTLRFILPILTITTALHAGSAPDIGNLNNCINEVRQANANSPTVPTFDKYKQGYATLIADLQTATPTLPYVYQEAAAKPLIQFLQKMGAAQFLRIFNQNPQDDLSQSLQQIIPDAVMSILFHNTVFVPSVDAFQEIASDLYDSFISEEARVSKESGKPINPPTYGIIPPLVKFGNAENGPYTWTCDATTQLLGMKCAIVSLPPAQIKGGLLAWSSLGHETSGHDVLHADAGLLEELTKKVHDALLSKFHSKALATYWSNCMDETTSDVMGNLNMGPAAGIGLIGYFRSFGNGKLRNVGSKDDPHPIDLLRAYLSAAVVKRLKFKEAKVWSQTLTNEAHKDDSGSLHLVDQNGKYYPFPTSMKIAIASTDVVAEIIMNSKLHALQGHSLKEIKEWSDSDQTIVESLISDLKANGQLPANLRGIGFYAAHVVSASTLTALTTNANISQIFSEMIMFLQIMHQDNPMWSKTPTVQALKLLERIDQDRNAQSLAPHPVHIQLPQGLTFSWDESILEEDAEIEIAS